MEQIKPETKKESYEKPELFKEGTLRDITAGEISFIVKDPN